MLSLRCSFSSVSLSFIILFSVVRWLGGSFAKLGLRVGLCGFANVQPIALAYYSIIVLKYPNSLCITKFLSKYKFESSQLVSGVKVQEWQAARLSCPTPCPSDSMQIGSEEQSVALNIALSIIFPKFSKSLHKV
jgi:hypothetical protein